MLVFIALHEKSRIPTSKHAHHTRHTTHTSHVTRHTSNNNPTHDTNRSGEHECQSCMYTYVPSNGDDFYPVSPGTAFKNLPEDWRCPTCGAEKSKFKNMGKQVAGFEQNQGYGFGTNSMTGGEKSVLIYGVLGIFFLFFIGGYLLD